MTGSVETLETLERPAEAAAASLPLLVLAGLLAGPFLTMVDSSVVNVAVPDIARSLNAGLATVQWTVSGYLLAIAAGLAASAWLTRRFGSRVVYVACLGAFTAASALCALAPNVELLIAFRTLQGVAGAPLTPIAMSMMMGGQGGAARQVSGGAAAASMLLFLAPAVGPSAGGFLIQAFGWPSIFLINVPFGVLGLAGALRIGDRFNLSPDRGARFDPLGMALLAGGAVLALYGAGQGASHGWINPGVWPLWSSGVLLLALYVGWAWRRTQPALDLSALRSRQGALTMALATLVSVVSFSALFLVPVLMQTVQGFSAYQAGLALLPQGVVMGLGSVLGAVVTRSGWVRLSVFVGSLVLVATTALMLEIDVATPGWETALILCGRGLAFGLITQPLLVGMMSSLSRSESADASTLFNVIQRLSGSFGIGLLASFFATRAVARAQAAPHVRGAIEAALGASFHDVVWILVVISVPGILLSLFLRVPPHPGPPPRGNRGHRDAGSQGSARCLSPSSRDRGRRLQARRAAPKAPPASRTKGGFWKRGPAPLLPSPPPPGGRERGDESSLILSSSWWAARAGSMRAVQAPTAAGAIPRLDAPVAPRLDRPALTAIHARRFLPGDSIWPGLLACDPIGGCARTELWLAWSVPHWSRVVVRLPREEHMEDLRVVRRLGREGRALRRLRHPAIPRLLEDAHDHPVPRLVLEHVEGATLDRILASDGPQRPGDVLRLGMRLASCLHHVHGEGLVHLGIEPANVAVHDGHVTLLDFGDARPVGGSSPPGRPRSPAFRAPELCLRARPDPRMDLFSLGALLYEAATGQPPFAGDEVVPGCRHPQLLVTPARARAVRPCIPIDLDIVIHALLERDARRRPRSALEALRLLAAALPPGEVPAWPAFADELLETG